MKVARDILNRLLLPIELMYLRNHLHVISKSLKKLKILNIPVSDILVISPHSDDEMLGLGGFIVEMSPKQTFHVLIPTASAAGETNFRLKESQKAFSGLQGTINFIPGELPDGDLLKNMESLKKKIINIISEKKIRTLFVPFPTELHPDHAACSSTVLNLLEEGYATEVFFFATNHLFLPKMINRCHKFPGNKKDKLRMLNNYQSQKKINFRKIVEVEQIYSDLFEQETFIELFMRVDAKEKNKIKKLIECADRTIKSIEIKGYCSISKIFGIIRYFNKNIRIIHENISDEDRYEY